MVRLAQFRRLEHPCARQDGVLAGRRRDVVESQREADRAAKVARKAAKKASKMRAKETKRRGREVDDELAELKKRVSRES